MQVSNLRFLDEHKHALQQYSMAVRIEERAGGDEYTASVHPTVLEEMLGVLLCHDLTSMLCLTSCALAVLAINNVRCTLTVRSGQGSQLYPNYGYLYASHCLGQNLCHAFEMPKCAATFRDESSRDA